MEPTRRDPAPVIWTDDDVILGDGSMRANGRVPRRSNRDHDALLDTAWRLVRYHKWLILQAVLVCALAAYLYSSTRPDEYTASSGILFRSATDDVLGTTGGFVDPSREAATNEALLSLGVVAERAAKQLGNISPAAVAASVEVRSDPEADIVYVDVTTESAQRSARIANTYGAAFIAFRRESARERIGGAIDLAEQALDQLTPEAAAGEEGRLLRERLNELQSAASLQTGDAELVQPASAPTAPSAPQPRRSATLGALLGLIIGFLLAALRDRSDRGIRDLDQLEEAFGRPVFAAVPRSSTIERDLPLPTRSAEAEAFRMLRASLRYASVDSPLASLLVASARPGEGKTTVAWRLAQTMSAMGDDVILVDADMHHTPESERLREDFEEGGLSGVLQGRPLEDTLQQIDSGFTQPERTFAYLSSGPLPQNPSELLESVQMSTLMDELEERYDLVIVDSPPLPILSDALPLVNRVSGVLAVAALGRSKRDEIPTLTRMVRLAGGRLIGVVANLAPGAGREAQHYYSDRA